MNVACRRYQLIELTVPAGGLGAGSRLYFQDQPQLRSQTNQLVIIKAIETFGSNATPKSPSGVTVAGVADLQNAFLVLNVAGTEAMQYIPFTVLNRVNDQGATPAFVLDLFLLDNQTYIDWTKSYIQFGATQSNIVSYLVGVYYEYEPGRPM